MNDRVDDIRILKIAEMYERAYESFVLEIAEKYVHDPAVKKLIHKLAGPNEKHGERIASAIERLNAQLGIVGRASLERAALRDVLDIERSARAFYMKYVEEVHDPGVAALFRALAHEEGEHIRIAEDALALCDKNHARAHLGVETERLLRLVAASQGEADPLGEQAGPLR